MRKNIFSLPILLFFCIFSSSIYAQTDLTGATVTLSSTEYEYDGTAKEPTVSGVRKGTKRYNNLKAGTDYDITYENNVHAGIAIATLTFKGDYTGVATKDFNINPKDLSKEVTLELDAYEYNYDGTAKEPTASELYYGEIKLISGVDYDLTYNNNINPGTATAKASFKGDYSGAATKDFKIIDSGIVPPSSLTVNYYDGSMSTPEVETEMTYNEFLALLENFPNAIAIAPQGFDVWPLDKKHIVVRGENEWSHKCNSFTLTDKVDFYSSVSFTAKTFSYTRDLVEGYNTVCLPVGLGELDIPAEAGIYLYLATSESQNQIYFLKFQEVSPGYAWLMKTQKACTWNLVLSDTRIEKTASESTWSSVGGLDFVGYMSGTYALTSKYKYDEEHPYYGLRNSDNMFAPLANTLSPFRACISIRDIVTSEARSFGISTVGSITEIDNVKAQTENKKIQHNGKFVKDGKIVIFKNGKTYNISGAEMK